MSRKVFKQLQEQLQKFFQAHQIDLATTPIGIGVSGGADSTTLLHLLATRPAGERKNLTVLHFDHRLRSDSGEQTRFVSRLCEKMNVPLEVGRWSESPFGISEDSARKARYHFFQDKLQQLGISVLALAHQADDQAETVLWRLLRGSAPRSLRGMQALRNWRGIKLIRPLLHTGRERILAYLQEQNQSFIEDSSNQKTSYLRNRIRLQLLPDLKQHFSPAITTHLVKLSEAMGREDAFMEEMLRSWIRGQKLRLINRVYPRKLLRSCPPGLRYRLYMRILAEHLQETRAEIKFVHLMAMEKLVMRKAPGFLALPGGWSLRAEAYSAGDRIWLNPVEISSKSTVSSSIRRWNNPRYPLE